MSEKDTGFTTMAGPKGQGEVPEIGIGMLGYAFMGKAHTNAYKTLPYMMYPPPALPRLVGVAGSNPEVLLRLLSAMDTKKHTRIGVSC